VTNTGTSGTSNWSVSFSLPAGDSIASSWNASLTQSGQNVTAASVSYNGSLSPGGSTSWGMVLNGTNQTLTGLGCTVH
jgi:cellulase/cellobiase CelA1